MRYGRSERLEVESPAVPVAVQGNELGGSAHEAHALEHSRIRRVGEDDLVARIRQDEEGVQHGRAVAVGDHDLAVGVVLRPAATGDQLCDR